MVAGECEETHKVLKEEDCLLSRRKHHLRIMRDCLLWNFAKVILFWTLADAQVRHWVCTGLSFFLFFSFTGAPGVVQIHLVPFTRRVFVLLFTSVFEFMLYDNDRNFLKVNYLKKLRLDLTEI